MAKTTFVGAGEHRSVVMTCRASVTVGNRDVSLGVGDVGGSVVGFGFDFDNLVLHM